MKMIFDIEFWTEVFLTIKSMRTRSLMTAFGVFWGIFMLTLLIGAGMGLDNGVAGQVRDLDANLLWVFPGETSMPYKGLGRDRKWKMDSSDEALLRRELGSTVKTISAIIFADFQNVTYGLQTYQYQVLGITPQFYGAIPQRVVEGRFINDIDLWEHRKVCVIGVHIAEALFDDPVKALGKLIDVNGSILKVVGVSRSTNDQIRIYRSKIEALIKESNGVHPDDVLALRSVSLSDQTNMYLNVIAGINLLIWIVGIGTFMAGLIGISNIMLITVKERTQEIGVRRAIGAQPSNIVTQLLMESFTLTFFAGLAGLSLAIWLLIAVNQILPQGEDMAFSHPYVPFWTAIISLLLLLAGGLMAGWLPAKRALAIKPIDALREE